MTGSDITGPEPSSPALVPPAPVSAAAHALVRRVELVVAELRRGGPVALGEPDESGVVVAVATETASRDGIARLRRLSGTVPRVALSRLRAAALGLCEPGPGTVAVAPSSLADILAALAVPGAPMPPPSPALTVSEAGSAAIAVVALTKLGGLVPAALTVSVPVSGGAAVATWARRHRLPFLSAAAVAAYPRHAARDLQPVAEARVPLADAPDARIVAFRPGSGGQEHLAIIVGAPDPAKPVLIRVHSACFTGDILGSLRCDCGEQLRRAIAALEEQGGGVVLYLAQEGRGIGLVNKLRAYALQDQGLDTFDANMALGFETDERLYLSAAEMLLRLGITRVRVMTNNPDKLEQLAAGGVEVVERVPHIIPSNRHNDAYLQAKALRAGHMF